MNRQIVAIALVLGAVLLAGCTIGEPPENATNATDAPSGDAADDGSGADDTDDADEADDADEDREDADMDTAETDGERAGPIGTYASANLTVTVTAVEYVTHLAPAVGLPSDAAEDEQYVVVDLAVANDGDAAAAVADALNVALGDGDNAAYMPTVIRPADPANATVDAGASEDARLVFTTPRDARNLTLRHTPPEDANASAATVALPDAALRYSVEHARDPTPSASISLDDVATDYTYTGGEDSHGTIETATVTVENTGHVAFRPRIDLEYELRPTAGNVHQNVEPQRLEDVGANWTELAPGESREATVVLDERVEHTGTYRVEVTVVDAASGAVLHSTQRDVTID